MSSPSGRKLPRWMIVTLGLVFVVLVIGAFIGINNYKNSLTLNQANATTTAQAQVNATATAVALARASAAATTTAQANASATVLARASAAATVTAQANASATVTAVQATLSKIICKYMYWQTGVDTDKPLTNFGVPQGCVLVLDSFAGGLNGVTWSNGGVTTLSPVTWSNGGVMAFPSGVYSGDIYNGEYAIVPEKDNPNPEQVFCNRVQQLVTNGYAFSNAQPLPEWGLPPGSQIVAQHHC